MCMWHVWRTRDRYTGFRCHTQRQETTWKTWAQMGGKYLNVSSTQKGIDWINLAQDMGKQMFCCEHGDEIAGPIQWEKFLTSLQIRRFLRRDLSTELVDSV